ncbi:linker for activation of T-cells family member 2 [Platysternon megacephalum]|uniref:Geraniol 8-hydroxylase-like n=1 Tax=Platysternon megacephalum TaxID=55544 RepID=A0A4D9F200_9SAUR|nr:geraniol 8-hydroxylase-like [Platysternon megacephalum]TFK13442.1 linker for activation of T-cells family member 2 [Platysternon megacephalum]
MCTCTQWACAFTCHFPSTAPRKIMEPQEIPCLLIAARGLRSLQLLCSLGLPPVQAFQNGPFFEVAGGRGCTSEVAFIHKPQSPNRRQPLAPSPIGRALTDQPLRAEQADTKCPVHVPPSLRCTPKASAVSGPPTGPLMGMDGC